MYRAKLYAIMTVLGILSVALFGGTPEVAQRPWEITMDIAAEYGRAFNVPYGLTREPNRTAVMLEDGIYYQWEGTDFAVVGLDKYLGAKSCKVSCVSGTFACCQINGQGEPVCRCRHNAKSDADCQGGGLGAESCDIVIGGIGD